MIFLGECIEYIAVCLLPVSRISCSMTFLMDVGGVDFYDIVNCEKFKRKYEASEDL